MHMLHHVLDVMMLGNTECGQSISMTNQMTCGLALPGSFTADHWASVFRSSISLSGLGKGADEDVVRHLDAICCAVAQACS